MYLNFIDYGHSHVFSTSRTAQIHEITLTTDAQANQSMIFAVIH